MDDNGPNESNVKVAVRVRPMNRRGKCTFHVIVHFSVVAAQSLVSPPVKSVLLLSVREQSNSEEPLSPVLWQCRSSSIVIKISPLSLLWECFGRGTVEMELGGKTSYGQSDVTH